MLNSFMKFLVRTPIFKAPLRGQILRLQIILPSVFKMDEMRVLESLNSFSMLFLTISSTNNGARGYGRENSEIIQHTGRSILIIGFL